MGALMDGLLTVWSEGGGGFSRRVVGPARVEDRRSAAFGAVQPVAGSAYGDGLKAYLASSGLVACGDYVAAGDVRSDLPCDGSRRVTSVEDMTLLGAYHHTEVVAR